MQSQIVLTLDAMLSFSNTYYEKNLWDYEWVMSKETYEAILCELNKDPFDKTTNYECTYRLSFLYCNESIMSKLPNYVRPHVPRDKLLFGLPFYLEFGMGFGEVQLKRPPLVRPSTGRK
jgi:hypothetical protein